MSIQIKVVVFAMLRERLGWSIKTAELADGATVADALEALVPTELRRGLATAVNQEYSPARTVLRDGDELAILPPVSGGAGPFRITARPLDLAPLVAEVRDKSCGAVVTFLGTSRELPGDRLEHLSYEAYPEMAEKSFHAIAAEAKRRFGVERLAIEHRIGKVPAGEASVAIALASPHRAEAIDALRFVIDTLKETAAIWKKEVTVSGHERWVVGKTARRIGADES